jgi:hypothetical protein
MVGVIQTTTAVPTALPACKQTTQEAANNIVAFKAPVENRPAAAALAAAK